MKIKLVFYIKSITIFEQNLSFFNTLYQQKKKSSVIDINKSYYK